MKSVVMAAVLFSAASGFAAPAPVVNVDSYFTGAKITGGKLTSVSKTKIAYLAAALESHDAINALLAFDLGTIHAMTGGDPVKVNVDYESFPSGKIDLKSASDAISTLIHDFASFESVKVASVDISSGRATVKYAVVLKYRAVVLLKHENHRPAGRHELGIHRGVLPHREPDSARSDGRAALREDPA